MINEFQLNFSAYVDPAYDFNKLPSGITGIAYSGGIVHFGGCGLTIIDVKSLSFKNPVFLLDSHERNKRLGLANLRIDGYKVLMTATFVDDESTLTIRRQLKEGMQLNLSIGFIADFENPKEPVMINGQLRQFDTVFRNARVVEVSVVSFPADPDARIEATFSEPEREKLKRSGRALRREYGVVGETTEVLEQNLFNQVAGQFKQRHNQSVGLPLERPYLSGKVVEDALFEQVAGGYKQSKGYAKSSGLLD